MYSSGTPSTPRPAESDNRRYRSIQRSDEFEFEFEFAKDKDYNWRG